jgi:hypothetical protein
MVPYATHAITSANIKGGGGVFPHSILLYVVN